MDVYFQLIVCASLVAQMVKNWPAMRETGFDSWVGKSSWTRAWQPTPVFLPGESPWTVEPGELQSMGSQRVRHNWATQHTNLVYWDSWHLYNSDFIWSNDIWLIARFSKGFILTFHQILLIFLLTIEFIEPQHCGKHNEVLKISAYRDHIQVVNISI